MNIKYLIKDKFNKISKIKSSKSLDTPTLYTSWTVAPLDYQINDINNYYKVEDIESDRKYGSRGIAIYDRLNFGQISTIYSDGWTTPNNIRQYDIIESYINSFNNLMFKQYVSNTPQFSTYIPRFQIDKIKLHSKMIEYMEKYQSYYYTYIPHTARSYWINTFLNYVQHKPMFTNANGYFTAPGGPNFSAPIYITAAYYSSLLITGGNFSNAILKPRYDIFTPNEDNSVVLNYAYTTSVFPQFHNDSGRYTSTIRDFKISKFEIHFKNVQAYFDCARAPLYLHIRLNHESRITWGDNNRIVYYDTNDTMRNELIISTSLSTLEKWVDNTLTLSAGSKFNMSYSNNPYITSHWHRVIQPYAEIFIAGNRAGIAVLSPHSYSKTLNTYNVQLPDSSNINAINIAGAVNYNLKNISGM